MKHMQSLYWFLVFIVVIPLLTGCRHDAVNYDSRLTRADSMIATVPDSALHLLEAMDVGQLATEGDRAYHALLLSQARYRCYVVATSDSLINFALNYYERHAGEREKLTRAHIYKGGVMEELGQPEEAMQHFKQALDVAAPNDYFNQGYARLRIGKIYQDNLVADSSDIIYLKGALRYFEQVPDSFYVMTSAKALGLSWFKLNKDSALIYLEQARGLAKRLHNKPVMFTVMGGIANIKMFSHDAHDIALAKGLALSILEDKDSREFNDRDNLLLTATFTLAKQHKPDSAAHYLQQVGASKLSDGLQVLRGMCLAEIALCRGDIDSYQHYFEEADHIADSVETNAMQLKLRDVETKYDNEALKYKNLRYQTILWLSLLGALLMGALLTIALLVSARKASLRKQQLKASEEALERLHNDKELLEAQLADNQAMSEGLKGTIRHQIDTFTQLVELHRKTYTRNPKVFGALFKSTYEVYQPDGSFWQEIRNYVDATCGNIITSTVEAHPSLRETDVRFLSLCCCDLPTTVIMACMGYNDSHSMYNKKRRLAEELGCPGHLNEYIMAFRPPKRQQDDSQQDEASATGG